MIVLPPKGSVRFAVRSTIGSYHISYPLLRLWHRWRGGGEAISDDTGICIEGPPRSANNFAVNVFRKWNPEVRVAHHLHSPIQLRAAVERGVPSILLIRDPKAVVASIYVANNRLALSVIINAYIRFYECLLVVEDRLVVAKFEDTIARFHQIVREVNRKFNASFISEPMSAAEYEQTLHDMRSGWVTHKKPPLLMPVPEAYRELKKNEVQERITECAGFAEAEKIYQHWCRGSKRYE